VELSVPDRAGGTPQRRPHSWVSGGRWRQSEYNKDAGVVKKAGSGEPAALKRLIPISAGSPGFVPACNK
jgi:hypothetical protein